MPGLQGGGTYTSIIVGRKVPQSTCTLDFYHLCTQLIFVYAHIRMLRYWSGMSNTSTFCLKLYNGTNVVHNVYCTTSFFCQIEHWFESCTSVKINKCITAWNLSEDQGPFYQPYEIIPSQLLLEGTLVEMASFSITGHDRSCFQYYLFRIPYTATLTENSWYTIGD